MKWCLLDGRDCVLEEFVCYGKGFELGCMFVFREEVCIL